MKNLKFFLLVIIFSSNLQAKTLGVNNFIRETTILYLEQNPTISESSIEKKQKSVAVAIALGFDPIPGDGLLYSGKKVQGGFAMTMGILGGALVGVGLAKNCHGSSDYGDCVAFKKDFPIAIGASLYSIAYLWDGIGSLVASQKFKQ